jgi:hypothetical protein
MHAEDETEQVEGNGKNDTSDLGQRKGRGSGGVALKQRGRLERDGGPSLRSG